AAAEQSDHARPLPEHERPDEPLIALRRVERHPSERAEDPRDMGETAADPRHQEHRAGQRRRQKRRSRDPRPPPREEAEREESRRDPDEGDRREELVREARPAGIGKDRRLDAQEEQADDAEPEQKKSGAPTRGGPE